VQYNQQIIQEQQQQPPGWKREKWYALAAAFLSIFKPFVTVV
jgi:hypothetical protein